MELINKIFKYGTEYLINSILSKIFFLFPTKNIIFFESVPNCSDSPKAVFDELVKMEYNRKYKMVWWLYDDSYKVDEEIQNVSYISGKKHRLLREYYEYNSKCLVSCNRFLERHKKNQTAFYICHGSPLKQVKGYYHFPPNIDFYFGASTHFAEELSKQLSAPIGKEIDLGLPRNDEFGAKEIDTRTLFDCEYKKIIVWYPTFRQHRTGVQTGCAHEFPIVYDANAVEELDRYAKEKETLIVIKPHFAQDLSMFNKVNTENIVFINDEFFIKNKLTSYGFINSCDALISDYSSIYYDYLLCDKPVALVWEDIEEYRVNPGFSVDIDYYCKGGVKVYTLEDLKDFIAQVATGRDQLKKERNEINSIVNYSNDRQNTKRVTKKIIELAKL